MNNYHMTKKLKLTNTTSTNKSSKHQNNK